MGLQIIHGERAFAQFTPDEQAVILRAARRQWLSTIAKKVNNQDPAKRAIIAAAQRRRWAEFRANRLKEQHAYNTAKGLPLDTPIPRVPKPKPKRVYSRMELLDILEAEMEKVFPGGPTKENEQAWLNYKPKDPRLEGHV